MVSPRKMMPRRRSRRNDPSGKRRASSPQAPSCHAVCFLPPLRSGPVGSGRAGRRCVRCSGPHETALRQPAPSPSFLHFAALRSVTSAPAESAPALRCAWCRGGGSAIPLPLVALRLRSLRSLRPGPHGRALARDRAARLRLLSRAVTDQHVPLKRLHGRRRHRSALKAALTPSPTVPARRSCPRA
jgi:hypothetical protein